MHINWYTFCTIFVLVFLQMVSLNSEDDVSELATPLHSSPVSTFQYGLFLNSYIIYHLGKIYITRYHT